LEGIYIEDLSPNADEPTAVGRNQKENLQRIEELNGCGGFISWVFQSVGKIFAFFATIQL
jgi:hypothetical protein